MDYKEKLEEAKRLYEIATADQKYLLESLFPELKSRANERIRKEIISFLRSKNGYMNPNEDWDFHNRWLPWLEKQGEQKPAWSEEDENGLGDALWAIQQARTIAKDENDMGNLWYAEHWLKSLKDRVQPQPQKD